GNMKLHWNILLGLTLAGATCLAAERPRFRFSKQVDWSGSGLEEIVAIPLDGDIYFATRDGFPDLRIRDDAATEVPYVLEQVGKRRAEHVREGCASRVTTLRVSSGTGLEIVVQLAEQAPSADGLTILTPLSDYEHRVKVFGSYNAKDWKSLVADGLI